MKAFLCLSLATTLVACLSSEEIRRQQYDADYAQAQRSCGRPELAFQSGYNAGFGHQQMRGDWTSLCVPDVRTATITAYQDGFVKGANNAPLQVEPVRVVHSVRPGGYSSGSTGYASAPECTFDSDCGGDGYHCRNHACQGFGGTGESCTFNDDCLSDSCFGGTCRAN